LRLAGHTSLATVDETIIARVPRQSALFDAPVTREGEPCDD
jgi:hypothetical protein